MNKVNVGLGGISRNTDDGVSKDGMCSELINARPKRIDRTRCEANT